MPIKLTKDGQAAEVEGDMRALPDWVKAVRNQRRKLFASTDFKKSADLLQHAMLPGPTQEFARYALSLRKQEKNRITWVQFCDAVRQNGGGYKWWQRTKEGMFRLYQEEVRSCLPKLCFCLIEKIKKMKFAFLAHFTGFPAISGATWLL